MTERILVPYDGSAPSKKALEYTVEKFDDPAVTTLYVVPAPEGYWTAFEDDEMEAAEAGRAREQGQETLDEARETGTEHGHDVDTEVVTGKPDRAILDYAEDEEYDTIVMGSHGREGVSRVLLGSVAESVVRRSPIPVVVVR
ncbi:universal stress protein [Natronobacterium gregoryi]|uniref:Universal stress protein n=2 Tax=Natronobacterium gregoryi TaxID=44930 RepID=L0ACR0_NATGS|nr:universal stress protein [Natronobacterium gregoryi]AFZ71683.1 universal stress protein UspA-like protein [Natronobacterium gregoryi SP2]ELY72745.1 UspA domain-containing protein [Natronobacterium gregoryi SP2]PLK20269.1 universal stress protein [Natronobacterium gregoryi SP2]SFJ25022.1 Nucleotide-binding universal stress protein, UspA family [Natronobacterium gregoryi]